MFGIKDLERFGCSERVIGHCIAVSKMAIKITESFKVETDKRLIEEGAILHDIGRCRTHGIDHAVVGANLARDIGACEEVVNIVERHIGAGITREEAVSIGLPSRDYLPTTFEEKIVAYSDNLTNGAKCLTFEESLRLYKKIMGNQHPSIQRFIALHDEIKNLCDS